MMSVSSMLMFPEFLGKVMKEEDNLSLIIPSYGPAVLIISTFNLLQP